MNEIYNVYCDETCHLENDDIPVMVLGAVVCPQLKAREIAIRLKEIKVEHGLPSDFEIKWTKVSQGQLAFYQRIRWARPIIENETATELRVWTEHVRGGNRIHLWHHAEDYVVVISERNGYYMPWTAFYVSYPNYRIKLERRWRRNRNKPKKS